MATLIHPGSFVDPAAQLGVDVEIMAGAVVTKWARLGDHVVVHPGAVVGGDPQYLGFDRATPSWVDVGKGTVLRENVTLNRSMYADQATTIGARGFFMAGSHAGHDCAVAADVVLANNAMLAGHVSVGANTFVGGGAGIHQFVRIGAVVMVAGLARVTKDVPPYCMVAERDELVGLNLVGLKRRGWPPEVMRELKAVYRAVMRPTGNLRTLAAELLPDIRCGEAQAFLRFFEGGKRPVARPSRARDNGGVDGDG
ncbi:acyl-ACP--UDP-N-acetylglucosamine O-acyltransferase [Synoicihabitans lomoniglobus]|uniref:Acyl-ACP--UDP-N-acetylglucosamine O-acyltransferase n=1 Tax=Synoicihabitans lomoniglobus TaxID=2909285 RepID=A0AAF0I1J0_9BACT|nr:acyl-ACP--UDP-N-acetylglucosamine O-acyltransferase [Opitutaceae bacterium LMO-M01]WED65817.1 acyl-ACP--UDP-N-acetylglucosamine O-acyltransferase [Opitutaceae bacterium LMO-M01]